MKHIFVDQMTGKTIKEINRFPLRNRLPDFLTLKGERYVYVYSDRYIDENRQEYVVVVVNKVVSYTPGRHSVETFVEQKPISRFKTSPDGNSQIFTDSDGRVFHRSKISELKWSAWTQYV